MNIEIDEDSGTCGICGLDPVEHEGVEIGLTLVNMCEECYQRLEERKAARLAARLKGKR